MEKDFVSSSNGSSLTISKQKLNWEGLEGAGGEGGGRGDRDGEHM